MMNPTTSVKAGQSNLASSIAAAEAKPGRETPDAQSLVSVYSKSNSGEKLLSQVGAGEGVQVASLWQCAEQIMHAESEQVPALVKDMVNSLLRLPYNDLSEGFDAVFSLVVSSMMMSKDREDIAPLFCVLGGVFQILPQAAREKAFSKMMILINAVSTSAGREYSIARRVIGSVMLQTMIKLKDKPGLESKYATQIENKLSEWRMNFRDTPVRFDSADDAYFQSCEASYARKINAALKAMLPSKPVAND